MQSTTELEFADGEYTFALPLPQIDELQTKCGIGIGGLFQRLYKGVESYYAEETGEQKLAYMPQFAEFHMADIVETIRQGLIGGGKGIVDGKEIAVTPAIANRLIQNYVAGKPLIPHWNIACSIVGACVIGYDPPKKDQPDAEPATETATAD